MTTFLGIPVDGDIMHGGYQAEQRPLEDLAPLLQAVLDDEGIACFGWTQYTPYFNDGDPCEFRAHPMWAARYEDLPESGEDDDLDKDNLCVDYARHLGSYEGGQWMPDPDNPNRRINVGAEYVGPDQARYDRCLKLSKAIGSGAFDDVLIEAFGDHAQVTIRRDGITVEFYDHD